MVKQSVAGQLEGRNWEGQRPGAWSPSVGWGGSRGSGHHRECPDGPLCQFWVPGTGPDVHPRAQQCLIFQVVCCGEGALRCVLGKVERILNPVYSPSPSSFLSPWRPRVLGEKQDAGAPALNPLLLLLQVLGALFLAIGLWAWGEKVRWGTRAWGCHGSKCWEGQHPHLPLLSRHRVFSPISRR